MALVLALAMLGVAGRATAQGTPVAGSVEVTGKLTRVMAIGAETSGWEIQLESEQAFGGKPVKSIEVVGNEKKLQKLENKKVTATGTIVHRSGVETADRVTLQVEKVKQWKEEKPRSEPKSNY
jgi:hypothetical protein